MPPREVLVTYTLYPSGNSHLRNAIHGVDAQFPLRNLHWKSSSRTSLRTIQEANVRLVELSNVPPPKEHVSGSVLETPLVHACFIACDDSDVYKNSTRSFIKDWQSLVQSRRSPHTTLIVLVNPPSAGGTTTSTKNVFGRDKGIIAKLKTDFNTSKRDICVVLNLPPAGSTDPAAWPDVTNKLKESIVLAFDSAILEREEEVKRGEAQRVTVGWNFCTWFLLKESLAFSFEGVHLYEDALLIYEELDAAFLQCLKERKLSWFSNMGGNGLQDDSLNILDTDAKPHREQLASSTISIFDFRIYVFARQCILLGKIGRITEIAKRGQWFVASLARRLREAENRLPKFFVESWTYTACMNLVGACDEWSRLDRPNNDYSGLIAYESARSELLDIARVQVERIGVATGHLPEVYPFRAAPVIPLAPDDLLFEARGTDEAKAEDAAAVSEVANRPLSNQTIVDALKDSESFIQLYEVLTKKALGAYEACGKVNSAVRLKADLAGLAIHQKDYTSAYELSRALAKDCAELHVWDPVSQFALETALSSHTELQLPRDNDWANLALAYLRVSAVATTKPANLDHVEGAVAGLKELTEPRTIHDSPVFHLRLLDNSPSFAEDAALTQLRLQVDNHLPVPVSVADVWLDFESEVYGRLNYSSGAITLQPGTQVVIVSCSTSVSGSVTMKDATVSIGQITFVTTFPKAQAVLPINRNPIGLRVDLHMPRSFSLDEEPRVVLEVLCGRQPITNAKAMLVSCQEEVRYRLDRATSDSSAVGSPDGVVIGNLAQGEATTISIPYAGSPRNDVAKVKVALQYESPSGRQCSYLDVQTLFMGLPLTVNVQDFFRPSMLLSSFSVASDGRETLRVGPIDLHSPADGYTIEPCQSARDAPILVAPGQPLSCLFKVKPKDTNPTSEVLKLSIQYHTVDEEVKLIAETALDKLPEPSIPLARAVRERLQSRGSWLQRYLLNPTHSEVFDDAWRAELPKTIPASVVEGFATGLGPTTPPWRTLQIPVEIPLHRLLTTVTLKPTALPASVYEGRALPFDMRLSTSLSWLGSKTAPDREFKVTFDVHASSDDWIVVGKKRGVYVANPEQPEESRVVLVPVRPGTLALPSISVQLVNEPTDPSRILCETYVSNAAQGIHVLPARSSMAALVPVEDQWAD